MLRFFLLIFITISCDCLAIEAHKAEYQLSLFDNSKETGIKDIKGKSNYVINEECHGWNTTEKILLSFKLQNNIETNLSSVWSTFETFSGNSYQFDMTENINGQETSNFIGFSNISKDISNAKYFSDGEYEVSLNENIEFPITHLKNLILAAQNNKKIYSSNLFLGSEFSDSYKIVTAIIGRKKVNEKYTFSNNLYQRFYWPVNLAYYTPGKEKDNPEYTISAQLQQNGVIIRYVIDYGEFSINSELNDLNRININKCK